jgi:hypothetical protein
MSPMTPEERQAYIDDINENTRQFDDPGTTFDPVNASDQRLHELGLPPRPNRDTHRAAYDHWLEMVQTPLEGVHVEFDLYPPADNFIRGGGVAARTRTQASLNWSGASVTPRNSLMFTEVTGKWTVPQVTAPPAIGEYRSSTWIGLDGQRSYRDATLPQIGTAQRVKRTAGGTAVEVLSWVEWYPGKKQLYITTLGFATHHVATAYVQVLPPCAAGRPQRVRLFLRNLTLLTPKGCHPHASFEWEVPKIKYPYPNSPLEVQPDVAGGTAEWVMERPRDEDTGALYELPLYDKVVFGPCFAFVARKPGDVAVPQPITGPTITRMYRVAAKPTRTQIVSVARRTGENAFETTPPRP